MTGGHGISTVTFPAGACQRSRPQPAVTPWRVELDSGSGSGRPRAARPPPCLTRSTPSLRRGDSRSASGGSGHHLRGSLRRGRSQRRPRRGQRHHDDLGTPPARAGTGDPHPGRRPPLDGGWRNANSLPWPRCAGPSVTSTRLPQPPSNAPTTCPPCNPGARTRAWAIGPVDPPRYRVGALDREADALRAKFLARMRVRGLD